MKAVVTGGSGFIGSCLVKLLINELDFEVLNIDKLTYASHSSALKSIENKQNYRFLKTDICDQKTIEKEIANFKPDVIFHLAAESHVDRSIESANPFIHSNISGTFSLLDVALSLWKKGLLPKNFRFLHVSTDEVYGSLELGDPPVKEGAPYRPNSPYSASKASSDLLVRAWFRTHHLPTIITHCTNNYGEFQHDEKLIPTVIRTALQGENIPLYGNGKNIRDWLYVEDHCRALIAIFNEGDLGEVYNISASEELSNIQITHSICEILDGLLPRKDAESYKKQIRFVNDRAGHDLRYSLDNSKILAETSWKSHVTFYEGLLKTVKWYQKEYYERNHSSGRKRHPPVPLDKVHL